MDTYWNLSGTIRDYDFTKRSAENIKRITDTEQFREKDSETIFQYLSNQMEIVPFGDYLKRYLYEKCEMSGPFREIEEETFVAIISDSFSMNHAPHAFTPVTSKWRNMIKRWLRSTSVKRTTVFLLGFGLNMPDQDVSMFLKKVLKEQDFDFTDPDETIFWYCFHNALPYSEAVALKKNTDIETQAVPIAPGFWASLGDRLSVYLSNPVMLHAYLRELQIQQPNRTGKLRRELKTLYDAAVPAARKILAEADMPRKAEIDSSGAYDIERVLYCGIRRGANHNLEPAGRSMLSSLFSRKRMDRQHLSLLLRGQMAADRFDLLTLQFLIVAATAEERSITGPGAPKERLFWFIDTANAILRRCDLWELYPVNPYEGFLLMCLLTEDPICVFNDVWEMAYEL